MHPVASDDGGAMSVTTLDEQTPPARIASQRSEGWRSIALFLWAAFTGFGTYFCMYGVREPFKTSDYHNIPPLLGRLDFKTFLITSQVLGYTLSKFIGIRFIAEMKSDQRPKALVALVGFAELALVGFGLIPPPWNAAALLLNGLALGMVFGLVMGFLEGRRHSEAMLAALCSSFVAAPGVCKGVGKWVLTRGIGQFWMPSAAGLIFFIPLIGFVWALKYLPQPDERDVAARSSRQVMGRRDRRRLIVRYWPGLTLVMLGYLLLTVMRSIRGDYATEIWKAIGVDAQAATFASSETIVAIVTLLLFGTLVFIGNNRAAFFSAVILSITGFAAGVVALLAFKAALIKPFAFIVMLGISMYLPYMAVHTTLFERLLATTRDKGNIGFLMYLVDAFGYLGYVGVIICEGFLPHGSIIRLFYGAGWVTMIGGMTLFVLATVYFARHPAVRNTAAEK
jgi:hypothetical protein